MTFLNRLLRQAYRHAYLPTHRPTQLPPIFLHTRPTTPIFPRHQLTTTRLTSTAALEARRKVQLYPETINIYRAGTPATLTVGLYRLSTIVIFLVGSGIYAPAFYFSPDHSTYLVPVYIIASAIPALVVALTTGPMIHGIRITLPEKARRGGKEGLRKWSESNTPGNTLLELSFMRWKPWPITRHVELQELRRLKPSFASGIANLEHIPKLQNLAGKQAEEEDRTRRAYPMFNGMLKRWFGRFYVKRDQSLDRAAVPGVWDGIWKQIPWQDGLDGAPKDDVRETGNETRNGGMRITKHGTQKGGVRGSEGETRKGVVKKEKRKRQEGGAAKKESLAPMRPVVPPMSAVGRP